MIAGTLQLASAADERYLPHLGAMLHSLFQSTPGVSVTLHFLHRPGLAAASIEPLAGLCRRHGALLRPRPVPSELVAQFAGGKRYPEEAWYRVLLPSLLPDVDRVLWVDADALVIESIVPLWQAELAGKPLAAVLNALAADHRGHPQSLGMESGAWRYFNTGVMVLDLARLRAGDAEARLRKAEARLRDRLRFADQDVFNPVFSAECMPLPLHWNVTAGAFVYACENIRVHGWREYRRALRAPKIVHFTLHKPWLHASSHPYRDRYLEHRRAAGWPAPSGADRTWKSAIGRRLPLALRVMAGAPERVGFADLAALIAVRLDLRGAR